ncbi:MAG: TadE/TadG family type IV pilus assembly protein [Myxococcota bacterium]
MLTRRPRTRRPNRARRRARRGQSAVLIAMVLFVMLLLVAMSTNIGTVVNDKIRMQSTADLATYAVAYSEAASLNEMTELNKGIVDAVQNCRTALAAGIGIPGTWPETTPCGCQPKSMAAETFIQTTCKPMIDLAISRFISRAQYDQTVGKALSAGEATAEANFRGVDIDFFQGLLGSPTMRGTYWLRGGLNLGPSVALPSIADIHQVTDTALNYRVFMTCPMPPSGQCTPVPPLVGDTTYVKSWFYKDDKNPEIWVAGRASGTPERQFLDTDYSTGRDRGYFGASSTGGDDKIYAYAVAKPYEGSLGPSEISGTQQNGNGYPILGVYSRRGAGYPELSMYDEYRARLAGTQENLEGPVTPEELIFMDGLREGRMWDMSKFRH